MIHVRSIRHAPPSHGLTERGRVMTKFGIVTVHGVLRQRFFKPQTNTPYDLLFCFRAGPGISCDIVPQFLEIPDQVREQIMCC